MNNRTILKVLLGLVSTFLVYDILFLLKGSIDNTIVIVVLAVIAAKTIIAGMLMHYLMGDSYEATRKLSVESEQVGKLKYKYACLRNLAIENNKERNLKKEIRDLENIRY